jgi:zinc protease
VRATLRSTAFALAAAAFAVAAAPVAGAQDAAEPPPPAEQAGAEQAPAAPPAARAAEAAPVFPFPVHGKKLGNGFQVYVIPYDSPGTVAYFTVVRTGSREEVEAGHSGFAHFFEHMMFRGTKTYPTEAYNDVLKRMGADSNAFTTDDYTNYYIIGPAAELETMMKIESDRFQNLEYTEEVFRTESLAVLGEYNKNASSPFLPMYERMRELAFTKHTYRHTTLGFLADIEAMPGYYDYSLRFFDRFYRPENAVLLVVGDVDPAKTLALAGKHYAGWKKGFKPVSIETEPPQRERKTARLDWPSPTRPHLMMGYHVPAFDAASRETATLDVIAQLLFSEAAPLHQELVVDEQWVDFVSGDASFHRDPYLFTVFSRIKSDDLVPKVEQRIAAHVEKLKNEPVDAARLERVKSHLRYQFALGLDTPGAVGFAAAEMVNLTGEVAPLNTLYHQYQQVTPADVQRVARQVFRPVNETVVILAHRAPEAPVVEGTAEGEGR